MEALASKINRIITNAMANIPSTGWENFSVTVFSLNKMVSMEAFYEEKNQSISFDPEANGTDIMMEFRSLREMIYNQSPNKGAWYTAILKVSADLKLNLSFNYDEKPNYTYEPSRDKFVNDLGVFPREEGLIPGWVSEIIDPKNQQ